MHHPAARLLLSAFAFVVAVALHAALPEPVELVDPFIGSAGQGSCMPGPCLPHASIYPSPATLKPNNSGYRVTEDIVGFAQLHTQGTGGKPSYGNFLVTPSIGLQLTDAARASGKAEEHPRAYAYSVRLTKHDIGAAVTPSQHSALYRFDFPASDDAVITLDVGRKIGGSVALEGGSVKVDAARGLITGGGRFGNNWHTTSYNVFFAAQVSETPTGFGTWLGSADQPGIAATSAYKQALGAYFRFHTTPGKPVYLKIAVSFTSPERAEQLLAAEIPAWDFDAVRDAARDAWREKLSTLTVAGVDEAEATRFYTALWHCFVQPRDRTGDVPGYDPQLPLWDDHYTLWDTWKTVFPLMTVIDPDMVRDNVRAFINRYRANLDGYVAEGFIQNKEFKVGQGGNETDNVIADAFARGITGVDWQEAYRIMQIHADGSGRSPHYRSAGWTASNEKHGYSFRMRSGSATLAFAFNDWNASRMAAALGHPEDAARYLARSQNWRKVWDPAMSEEGFSGFVHGRKLDGTFSTVTAQGGWNTDFYEGICWDYSYDVQHDVPGLVEAMGGKETFIRRLNHCLRKGYIRFNNEPAFSTVWLFNRVQRPYLTSHWTDAMLRLFPGRDLPGDDDSGAMSSLFLFLTSGLYPAAGQDLFWLHGPRVPEVVINPPHGKKFTIRGANTGPDNLYVQSATLNGTPLNQPWIRQGDILAGGELAFVMGPAPSAWGTEGDFNAARAAEEVYIRDMPKPPAVR